MKRFPKFISSAAPAAAERCVRRRAVPMRLRRHRPCFIVGVNLMSPRNWFRLAVLSGMLLAPSAALPCRQERDKDKQPPRETENSIGMKLVLIPRGKFTMGSP